MTEAHTSLSHTLNHTRCGLYRVHGLTWNLLLCELYHFCMLYGRMVVVAASTSAATTEASVVSARPQTVPGRLKSMPRMHEHWNARVPEHSTRLRAARCRLNPTRTALHSPMRMRPPTGQHGAATSNNGTAVHGPREHLQRRSIRSPHAAHTQPIREIIREIIMR